MKAWLQHIRERERRVGGSLTSKSKKFMHLLKTKLWLKVLVGLFLGIFVGFLLGPDAGLVSSSSSKVITEWLALPGNLFLQLVKMIIIPLVFSSIIIGIISSGNPEFLKKIGPRLALYFVITTTIATIIGSSVAFLIQPGSYVDISSMNLDSDIDVPMDVESRSMSTPEKIVSILPGNPFKSFVSGEMLGVVIFTMIVGIALLFSGKKHLEFSLRLLETIQDVSMRVVRWAMALVPYAVFGLMTQVTASIGLESLKGVSLYVLTVFAGLALLLVVYNIIILLFTKMNPSDFMVAVKDAQLLAFTTSSSAATMPISMKTAEDKLGVNRSISEFLIPVGATVNMDGTALYQVVATIFLSQAFGIHISILGLVLIMAITIGASIGAPSAPGTGIIILATILESAGIPAVGIAIILGVDRILDMSRTAVNVTGDLTACVFFDKWLGHLFEKSRTPP